jgi:APA family basic amino acid/polyamine antiporter
VFAFGGYHVIAVPGGEAADPRRHLPFAFPMTIIAVTIIMTLAQIVAMGTLPDLPDSATPLADASFLFMGTVGALLMSVGAVISMTGNNMGASLAGSRMLFALAESGDVPRVFAKIHPRHRTPSNAIIFTALVTLAFALSGSFTVLAVTSALGRLVIYLSVCTGHAPAAPARLPRSGPLSDFRHSAGAARPDAGDCDLLADARRRQPPAIPRRNGRASDRRGALPRQ